MVSSPSGYSFSSRASGRIGRTHMWLILDSPCDSGWSSARSYPPYEHHILTDRTAPRAKSYLKTKQKKAMALIVADKKPRKHICTIPVHKHELYFYEPLKEILLFSHYQAFNGQFDFFFSAHNYKQHLSYRWQESSCIGNKPLYRKQNVLMEITCSYWTIQQLLLGRPRKETDLGCIISRKMVLKQARERTHWGWGKTLKAGQVVWMLSEKIQAAVCKPHRRKSIYVDAAWKAVKT